MLKKRDYLCSLKYFSGIYFTLDFTLFLILLSTKPTLRYSTEAAMQHHANYAIQFDLKFFGYTFLQGSIHFCSNLSLCLKKRVIVRVVPNTTLKQMKTP